MKCSKEYENQWQKEADSSGILFFTAESKIIAVGFYIDALHHLGEDSLYS